MPSPAARHKQTSCADFAATAAARPRSSSRWSRRCSSRCCLRSSRLAMVFFASQVLETVTQDSARADHDRSGAERRLHPGAVQEPMSAASSPCMFDCVNGSTSTCRAIPRSPPSTSPTRSTRGKNFVPPTIISPGGPGDIVVVRLFYQWPLFVTGLGFNIANMAGSKRLLTATAAFQNEPYLEARAMTTDDRESGFACARRALELLGDSAASRRSNSP